MLLIRIGHVCKYKIKGKPENEYSVELNLRFNFGKILFFTLVLLKPFFYVLVHQLR